MKTNKLFGNSAIVAAVLASLCCVTPIIAIIAGLSGIASTFSFLEPLRPYFISLTVLTLAFAFYKAYKPSINNKPECDCETEETKSNFINSKKFLWTVTLVSVLLITFPYYSSVIVPGAKMQMSYNALNIQKAKLDVVGMSCRGCEASVNYALKSEPGVIKVKSNFKTGTAIVEYDKSKVTIDSLKKAIEKKAGYRIKDAIIVNK